MNTVSKFISVLVVIIAVIPAVYLVNLLPITARAKDIAGVVVGIIAVIVAVFLLRYIGVF
jgi:hypothetical protein